MNKIEEMSIEEIQRLDTLLSEDYLPENREERASLLFLRLANDYKVLDDTNYAKQAIEHYKEYLRLRK
tara:strand:+ start:263 stop:466 length:204 start_codon:yes stop_codon:yes gene_type:complete